MSSPISANLQMGGEGEVRTYSHIEVVYQATPTAGSFQEVVDVTLHAGSSEIVAVETLGVVVLLPFFHAPSLAAHLQRGVLGRTGGPRAIV